MLCYPWVAFEKDKDYGTWAVSLGRRGCFNWGGLRYADFCCSSLTNPLLYFFPQHPTVLEKSVVVFLTLDSYCERLTFPPKYCKPRLSIRNDAGWDVLPLRGRIMRSRELRRMNLLSLRSRPQSLRWRLGKRERTRKRRTNRSCSGSTGVHTLTMGLSLMMMRALSDFCEGSGNCWLSRNKKLYLMR